MKSPKQWNGDLGRNDARVLRSQCCAFDTKNALEREAKAFALHPLVNPRIGGFDNVPRQSPKLSVVGYFLAEEGITGKTARVDSGTHLIPAVVIGLGKERSVLRTSFERAVTWLT
jgi:hypothetical protein